MRDKTANSSDKKERKPLPEIELDPEDPRN
jgi:hypothetical protein